MGTGGQERSCIGAFGRRTRSTWSTWPKTAAVMKLTSSITMPPTSSKLTPHSLQFSQPPAQRVVERRLVQCVNRCFVDATTFTELCKTIRYALPARGDVLRVLLDLIQSLSVHSKYGLL